MTALPRGWSKAEISELVETQQNGKPFQQGWSPRCESRPAAKGEWGVLKTTAIQHGEFWSHENKALPTNLTPRPQIEIKPGDILITCAGPRSRCGVACIVEGNHPRLMMSGKMYRLRAHPEVLDPQFLSCFIRMSDTQIRIDAMKTGINDSGLNLTHSRFGKLPVIVPPLNEQKRIVEKIEMLFDEIDRGVESLRAAKNAVDLYRQSLLKSAFEGRLTAEWRAENQDKLESPDTLLPRIQEAREECYQATLHDWNQALAKWCAEGGEGKKPAKPRRPRAIPVKPIDSGNFGWTTVPLGLTIVDPIYGTSKKCDYDAGTTGVLRIPNIGSGRIDPTDLKSADFDETESGKYSLRAGDVLTVRSNGSLSIVGKPALVERQHTDYFFAGYLIRLRPIAKSLVPKYLVFLMMEPNVRAQIEAKAKSTSGVNNISAKELQELNVPICSPPEQREIVQILDDRFEAADMLDAEIDTALARAEALRQSILKRAFSGQLVPQDPADEPAQALIARIRASRDQHSTANPERPTHGRASTALPP